MVRASSELLASSFDQASFEFYGKTLSGLEAQRDREKRAVAALEESLGFMLGKIYVERHFKPEAKERMDQLIKNMRVAFKEAIDGLEWMSPETKKAAQEKLTRHRSEYVFCNSKGGPLAHKNVTRRVWYPLLEALKLKRRAPYQSRHTAATIWLASGESPEWIAKQLGHANTTMLFKVYSRYVPNLVRRDGTALERLLSEHKLPFETMGEALQELDYENV